MVLVAVVACTPTVPATTTDPPDPLRGFDRALITVGDEELVVLVADTPNQRRRGLMEVEVLPDGIAGMLFEFPVAASVRFHMKNTLIPLDIWWFDEQGTLMGSTAMEPCINDPCPSYRSPGAVKWALETPQGRYQLEEGARLSVYND